MKTMNREEAILAMLDGKKVTSDEFTYPDNTYCMYDKAIKNKSPFRYIYKNINTDMDSTWDIKTWRKRKYVPNDKELVWSYADDDIAYAGLKYYDAENNATFDYLGKRGGIQYLNYAPFDGVLPPNICTVQDLED